MIMAKLKEKTAGAEAKTIKAGKILDELVEKYSKQGIQIPLTKKEKEYITGNAIKKQNMAAEAQWLLVKTVAKKDAELAIELYVKIHEKKYGSIPAELLKNATDIAGKKGGIKGFLEGRIYLRSLGDLSAASKGVELGGVPVKLDKREEKAGKTRVEMLEELKGVNDEIIYLANLIPDAEKATVTEIVELAKKLEKDPGNEKYIKKIQELENLMKDIAKEKEVLQEKMKKRTALVKELGLENLYDKKLRYGLAGLESSLSQKAKKELANGTSELYSEIRENAAFVKKQVDRMLKEARA